MKYITTLTLLVVALALPPHATAFLIKYTYQPCSLDDETLQQDVDNVRDKLIQARRSAPRKSAYRRNAERQVKDFIGAFNRAQKNESCSEERKAQLRRYGAELKDLLRGETEPQRSEDDASIDDAGETSRP